MNSLIILQIYKNFDMEQFHNGYLKITMTQHKWYFTQSGVLILFSINPPLLHGEREISIASSNFKSLVRLPIFNLNQDLKQFQCQISNLGIFLNQNFEFIFPKNEYSLFFFHISIGLILKISYQNYS